MNEKAPAFLYEQFMDSELDDKEAQMVGDSFQYGQDEAKRILAVLGNIELSTKEGISADMAVMRLVLVTSAFLFKRGMANIVLTELSELAKKAQEDDRSSIGDA